MQDDDFINPYWHRIARARPRISEQIEVNRQEIRGKLWFILRNSLTGNQFRITPEAWYFAGLLDGSRTVQDAIEAAETILGEDAPRQGEVIRLLTQMHGLGALASTEQDTDAAAMFQQAQNLRRRKILQQMRSPLAIRFPLLDPERLLTRLRPLARVFFSRFGFLVWLGVISIGLFTALVNLDELSNDFVDRVLAAENLVLMTAVFVILKLCHEFGHGLAVKRWGGEVHEMGIMLLVLIPVPYVDATAANEFHSRLRRVAVSSAGMYVEMFLAALAIILWTWVEPGLVHAALYNAALIGSISTILFNLNPLLRFDGYYILSDLLALPNLGTRGTLYTRYLLERYVLWLDDAATPETDPTEKRWLFVYTISALLYRVFIVGLIAFFVAQKLFFVGVILALWAVTQLFVLPLLKGIKFLLFSPRLDQGRFRVVSRALLAMGIVVLLLFAMPAPRATYTYGVVWVPIDGEIVVESDAFIEQIVPREGEVVQPGQTLVKMTNAATLAERERLWVRRAAVEVQVRADFVTDRVALKLSLAELDQLDNRIANLDERIEQMTIRAQTVGRFALAVPEDLDERFMHRGQRLGFVIDPAKTTIRVTIAQNDIGLVRDDTKSIEILPLDTHLPAQQATLLRAIPAASAQLPSMALATVGGGKVEVVAGEDGQPRAIRELFHFELGAEEPLQIGEVGRKVHVKFVHSKEPLGNQALRRLRQLFLSQLNV